MGKRFISIIISYNYMTETIKLKARKWGNSLGVVIPNNISREMNLKENEEIEVILMKKRPLKKLYGILKGKIKESSQEMKDRLRKELYKMQNG